MSSDGQLNWMRMCEFFDGRLSEKDKLQLLDQLKGDSCLRQEFVSLMVQRGLLVQLRNLEGTERRVEGAGGEIGRTGLPGRGALQKTGVRRVRKAEVTSAARPGRRSIRWGAWLSVAACLAIIVGSLVYNHRRAERFPEFFIAHVQATVSNVRIIRNGEFITAVVDMRILPGDRIETGKKQNVTFVYENENTEITVDENTKLDVGGIENGKRLDLDRGTIDATVAPQPEDRPMILTTANARAEIRGTAFSLSAAPGKTRMEVTEGLVRLTRLSDREFVDVASGQYAVAAEGVALAALALPDWSRRAPRIPSPADTHIGPRKPPWPVPSVDVQAERQAMPRTHLYGKVLFEDDFSNGRGNWDTIVWTEQGGCEIAPPGVAQYVKVASEYYRWKWVRDRLPFLSIGTRQKDVRGVRHKDIRGIMLGVRSRMHIEADRFVIEVTSAIPYSGGKLSTSLMDAIELNNRDTVSIARREGSIGTSWKIQYWEFTPAGDPAPPDVLLCRWLTVDVKWKEQGRSRHTKWEASRYVRPVSKRIVLGSRGCPLVIDRVVVRELLEE